MPNSYILFLWTVTKISWAGSSDFFFSKKFFQEHYQATYQTVWIQIRTNILQSLSADNKSRH